MQPTSDSNISGTPVLRRILLIYGGLAVITLSILYLNGLEAEELFYIAMAWFFASSMALIFGYSRRLGAPNRRSIFYRYFYLAPSLARVLDLLVLLLRHRDIGYSFRNYYTLINIIIYVFDIFIMFFCAHLLRLALIDRVRPNTAELSVQNSPDVEAVPFSDNSFALLGQGTDYINRVVRSVIGRSIKSESTARFSLTVMLILVMVGGMASFGLWAFTHADRISTLEYERSKLINLENEVKAIRDKLGEGVDTVKPQLDRLLKFIDDNYSDSESYKADLARLSQQSQSNYADIAIRVTIAVLTIFLVQVFFSVYKYNRHLAIMLAGKAEALELVRNDDEARKELSREVISIVKETIPGFGSHPRTPIEEAIRATENIRKKE
jgi:hypothetical protein